MAAIQQVLMAVGTSVFLPSSLFAAADAISYFDEPASSIVILQLQSNGTLSLEYNANGTVQDPTFPQSEVSRWLVGGSSSLFSVRLRRISGSSFSPGSSAIDTWLPASTGLSWNILSSSNSFQPSNSKGILGVLEIAFTNNLTNILAQSDINFSTSALTQGGFQP
jgi:hypothetical protein